MKKAAVLFAAILFCLSGYTKEIVTNWMVTGDGKIDCKKISLGLTKAIVELEDGQMVDVNFDEISSFSMDGKVFVKLRLYEDNKPTSQMAFLELIKTWNDLSLYKLAVQSPGTVVHKDATSRYYLYNGTDYHLQLDERTLKTTCKEFGINYAGL
jgi:hypothetical protein